MARPALKSEHPVHVTLRIVGGRPSLRETRAHHALLRCFHAGRERFGFRLTQYSIQSNHLHLIVEADDKRALSRGMQGLGRRISWALSKLWNRRGRVFADRYHATALKCPRQVRNALRYVLHNARRHGIYFAGPDPYGSGRWFNGWNDRPAQNIDPRRSPLAQARTWLQTSGWFRHGPLSSNGARP